MTAFAAKLRQLYRVAENFDTGQRRQRTPGDYLSGNQSPARLLVASDRQRNVDDHSSVHCAMCIVSSVVGWLPTVYLCIWHGLGLWSFKETLKLFVSLQSKPSFPTGKAHWKAATLCMQPSFLKKCLCWITNFRNLSFNMIMRRRLNICLQKFCRHIERGGRRGVTVRVPSKGDDPDDRMGTLK